MELDRRVCDRARKSRDARFDGKFFIAVTSTRIYCRPICPARSPKDENVRYYATAAAAQAAGFRPCLRCRPEASPGHAGLVGHVERGVAGAASHQRRRARSRGRRGAGRSPRRDGAAPAPAVRAASWRDADRGRAHPPGALRQETDRRNTAADRASRVRGRIRQRAPPQRRDPQDFFANANRASQALAQAFGRFGRLSLPPLLPAALRLAAGDWLPGRPCHARGRGRRSRSIPANDCDRRDDGHDRDCAGRRRLGADARRACRRSACATRDRRARQADVRSRRGSVADCPAVVGRCSLAPRRRRACRHSDARCVGPL